MSREPRDVLSVCPHPGRDPRNGDLRQAATDRRHPGSEVGSMTLAGASDWTSESMDLVEILKRRD